MKGKKCFGLFLALFIMLGVSLGVSSGDSSALSYKVRSIPFFYPFSHAAQDFYLPLTLDIRSADSGYYDKLPEVWAYNTTWNTTAEKCFYTAGNTYNNFYRVLVNDGADIYAQGRYAPDWFDYSWMTNEVNRKSVEFCLSVSSFGTYLQTNTMPTVNTVTHPNQNWGSWLPYWYPYNGAYISDSYTEDGLNRRTKLDLATIFSGTGTPASERHAPNKFKKLVIPLGLSYQTLGALTSGRPISVEGEFLFDNYSDPSAVMAFAEGATPYVKLYIRGYESLADFFNSQNNRGQTINCTYSLSANSSTTEYPWIFKYTCSGLSAYNFLDGYYGLTLEIGTSTGSYLWDYESYVMDWDSSIIVTDNDKTDSGVYFGQEVTGGDADDAPGSASSTVDGDGEVDWLSSLVNLFNFNFINPFAPLFEMFTDNSECASIPIIAGMLGSTETQYCPWFDSSTRSILTPVLSIASIMLLFGFLVRWLSSSSGNMFEDQTTHKWGNTQFKQKGGD